MPCDEIRLPKEGAETGMETKDWSRGTTASRHHGDGKKAAKESEKEQLVRSKESVVSPRPREDSGPSMDGLALSKAADEQGKMKTQNSPR